jgi:hypothetical protein
VSLNLIGGDHLLRDVGLTRPRRQLREKLGTSEERGSRLPLGATMGDVVVPGHQA